MNVDRLPNWLRWALFFPAAVVALLLTYPIVKIGSFIFSPVDSYILELSTVVMGAGASGFTFVWCGSVIAPRHQSLISIIMASIYSLIVGMMLIAKLSLPHVISTSWFEVISIVLVGGVGAVFACHSFKDKQSHIATDIDTLHYSPNKSQERTE